MKAVEKSDADAGAGECQCAPCARGRVAGGFFAIPERVGGAAVAVAVVSGPLMEGTQMIKCQSPSTFA